ncbi:MAG: cobalamin-dependent protein [Pirellulales bacterium]|nr:cobalamin-dependent protein [Pirellulales bacterium]
MPNALREQLLERILAGDRRVAVGLVDQWAEIHGYQQAVVEILEPVLATFGRHWATAEDVSLAQGFVAGKVAEDILQKAAMAAREGAAESTAKKGPVVIGNIEDDAHGLGRRLVIAFLRLAGWEIHDLGEDVLAPQFVEKAVEVGAPIVAVSAMMYSTAMNIGKLRAEIDARGLKDKVLLAVGGAVFCQRPELMAMVGGDGTARNAIQVPELMDQLVDRALAGGASQ